MASTDSPLFKPLKIGKETLSNRIVMAPLTRFRSDKAHVPHDYVAEYYAQRAIYPGTLLITEATFISPQASGYEHVPGIWTTEQISSWKRVTAAVHEKESFIYLQLWALGRAASPDVLKSKGLDLVSSSPVAMDSDHAEPRALTEGEIEAYIQAYAQAAKNAIEAGFDGVEIHGANGYLIDQFTQDVCNRRTDSWGGSVENRAKFALQVTRAVVDAIGAEYTGIRLSPWSTFQAMKMDDPIPQFSHLIEQLSHFNLAYLHLVESRVGGNMDNASATGKNDEFFKLWEMKNKNPILVAGGFKPDTAKKFLDEVRGEKGGSGGSTASADSKPVEYAIVFGRYFISNPDLVYRIKHDIDLEHYDRDGFYTAEKTQGYIDYPFFKTWEK